MFEGSGWADAPGFCRRARTIENCSRIKMVVARASGMDLASILKRNTFLTLGVRPASPHRPTTLNIKQYFISEKIKQRPYFLKNKVATLFLKLKFPEKIKSRLYFFKVFGRLFLKFSFQKNKAATLKIPPQILYFLKSRLYFFKVFLKYFLKLRAPRVICNIVRPRKDEICNITRPRNTIYM